MKTRFEVHPFPSGLTLVLAAMPDMTSVSVGLWVSVGGRYESADLNGASHFIEHMLFKGTRRRSARAISQAVESLGGYLNAFTAEETTCYYAKAPHDHFADVLDVLADMLLHPRFDPDDFSKEREVIKEEVAMYRDQPQLRVEELLNALQWPDQPLGRPLTGTEQTLDRLTPAGLLGYRRAHYVAPAIVLAVAGRISRAACVRAATRLAQHLVSGPRRGFAPVAIRPDGPWLRYARHRGEQTQLALGIRTCSRHDERRYALRLLNVLLGENMSSHLFQALREDTGLVYHVASALSFFADTGDLVITAGLEPDHLERALPLVLRELRRLQTRAPGTRELRAARDYVIGQMALSFENSEHQMMSLGEQWLGHGRLFSPTTIQRRLTRVTGAEVQAVARDFLRPERLNLALVGPERPRPEVNRLLARL
jgi:predicted Zn-dependent peptidase